MRYDGKGRFSQGGKGHIVLGYVYFGYRAKWFYGLCYLQSEIKSHGNTAVGLASDLTDVSGASALIEQIQPELVMHLAGVTIDWRGKQKDFDEANLFGTRNLLVALANHEPNMRVLKGCNSRLKRLLGEWKECYLEETLRWVLREGSNC